MCMRERKLRWGLYSRRPRRPMRIVLGHVSTFDWGILFSSAYMADENNFKISWRQLYEYRHRLVALADENIVFWCRPCSWPMRILWPTLKCQFLVVGIDYPVVCKLNMWQTTLPLLQVLLDLCSQQQGEC